MNIKLSKVELHVIDFFNLLLLLITAIASTLTKEDGGEFLF